MGDPIVLAALISSVAGIFAGAGTAWLARPRTRAEAEKLAVDAGVGQSADNRSWAQLFAGENQRLREENDALDRTVDVLEGYARTLRAHIERAGGVPPVAPEPVRDRF